MGNLFGAIKELIRVRKRNFCSTGTRVIQIPKAGDPINPDDVVQYTTCDGIIVETRYSEVLNYFGIINGCVQGGCPIMSISDGSQVNYLVDYGTNRCGDAIPYSVELIPCKSNMPNVYIVFDIIKESGLQPGLVYYFNLSESSGCYTVGSLSKREYTVVVSEVRPIQDCNEEGC